MKSVPPRDSGWVNAMPSLPYAPTRYREVVLTSTREVVLTSTREVVLTSNFARRPSRSKI